MTKSGKHCGKRRNCSFWAISYFVTMFSKSCLLQKRQKTSIWGKGLIYFHINLICSRRLWITFKQIYRTYLQIELWLLNRDEKINMAKGEIVWHEQFLLLYCCSRQGIQGLIGFIGGNGNSSINGNITSFTTMDSKVVCSRGFKKHLYLGED